MTRFSLVSTLVTIVLISTTISPPTTVNSQMNQLPFRDPRLPVDQRVADLLGRMTLEEKVAQTQTLWVSNQFKSFADDKGNFSPDAKTQQLLKLGLGQLGGGGQAASDSEKAT